MSRRPNFGAIPDEYSVVITSRGSPPLTTQSVESRACSDKPSQGFVVSAQPNGFDSWLRRRCYYDTASTETGSKFGALVFWGALPAIAVGVWRNGPPRPAGFRGQRRGVAASSQGERPTVIFERFQTNQVSPLNFIEEVMSYESQTLG